MAVAFNWTVYAIERYDDATFEGLRRIGEAIRRARWTSGLSQRQLGAMAGLSQSTISRLECGVAPTVRFSRLAHLLMAMDSDIFIERRPSPAGLGPNLRGF